MEHEVARAERQCVQRELEPREVLQRAELFKYRTAFLEQEIIYSDLKMLTVFKYHRIGAQAEQAAGPRPGADVHPDRPAPAAARAFLQGAR